VMLPLQAWKKGIKREIPMLNILKKINDFHDNGKSVHFHGKFLSW
jgi:hypothetical protein